MGAGAVSFWSSLFAWGDVPFAVALGVAFGFALLQMSGILGALSGGADVDGGADGDADAHVDVDGGAHVDVDGDADVHVDGHADGDGDADGHDHEAGQAAPLGWMHALLVGVGVGKAPLFVLAETFTVVFALAGIAMNAPYGQAGAPPHSLAWTLPLALLTAFFTTRGVAGILGRLLGGGEASSRAGLVGLSGVVISRRVDNEFGEVRLRDRSGHVVRIVCRAETGEIPEGREVVVIDEDARDQRLVVAALDVRSP
jgi:hypothetical protein